MKSLNLELDTSRQAPSWVMDPLARGLGRIRWSSGPFLRQCRRSALRRTDICLHTAPSPSPSPSPSASQCALLQELHATDAVERQIIALFSEKYRNPAIGSLGEGPQRSSSRSSATSISTVTSAEAEMYRRIVKKCGALKLKAAACLGCVHIPDERIGSVGGTAASPTQPRPLFSSLRPHTPPGPLCELLTSLHRRWYGRCAGRRGLRMGRCRVS